MDQRAKMTKKAMVSRVSFAAGMSRETHIAEMEKVAEVVEGARVALVAREANVKEMASMVSVAVNDKENQGKMASSDSLGINVSLFMNLVNFSKVLIFSFCFCLFLLFLFLTLITQNSLSRFVFATILPASSSQIENSPHSFKSKCYFYLELLFDSLFLYQPTTSPGSTSHPLCFSSSPLS